MIEGVTTASTAAAAAGGARSSSFLGRGLAQAGAGIKGAFSMVPRSLFEARMMVGGGISMLKNNPLKVLGSIGSKIGGSLYAPSLTAGAQSDIELQQQMAIARKSGNGSEFNRIDMLRKLNADRYEEDKGSMGYMKANLVNPLTGNSMYAREPLKELPLGYANRRGELNQNPNGSNLPASMQITTLILIVDTKNGALDMPKLHKQLEDLADQKIHRQGKTSPKK